MADVVFRNDRRFFLTTPAMPESLFPALACQNILSLSVMDILVCTVVFFVGEVILARLFYKLHFRDRPY